MEGDGLPTQVCFECVHYITRAYFFKELCERSEATLKQLFGKSGTITSTNNGNNNNTTTTFHELKTCDPETTAVLIDNKSLAFGNILNSVENIETKLDGIVDSKFILDANTVENLAEKLDQIDDESKFGMEHNNDDTSQVVEKIRDLDQNCDPLTSNSLF